MFIAWVTSYFLYTSYKYLFIARKFAIFTYLLRVAIYYTSYE